MGGLPQAEQVGEDGKGLVRLPAGEGVGHLKDHRVDDGDGHGVNVLPGDPAALGIGADLFDLSDQAVHQVPAQEDEVLGVRRVNVVPQGPEAAADPVHQVPCLLAEEGDLRPLSWRTPASFFMRASRL